MKELDTSFYFPKRGVPLGEYVEEGRWETLQGAPRTGSGGRKYEIQKKDQTGNVRQDEMNWNMLAVLRAYH